MLQTVGRDTSALATKAYKESVRTQATNRSTNMAKGISQTSTSAVEPLPRVP